MATSKTKSISNNELKVKTDAELLSYIINSTPELAADIDLPVQGESIAPIGEIIVNNERYRNAFINTVNLIGLTVIKRNRWSNPWDFTIRGNLRFGQTVREIINDLVDAHDYNEHVNDTTYFLGNFVPNIYNYLHELNYQKFYATTTSDAQLAMAFEGEGSLFNFIDESIAMNYESWKYDLYLIDKYQLCRRIVNGTVTPSYLADFNTATQRERVSLIKAVSNDLTFRSPNYNPAGIRRATGFDEQILIVSTLFEAQFSTEVLATSFFRDEADMRARLVLCDGFGKHDKARLQAVLGKQYIPFTQDEINLLNNIPAVLISREWFMDYIYTLNSSPDVSYVNGNNGANGTLNTYFFNPTTLRNNHFLHSWMVFSTSPFENATVFSLTEPKVTSITLSPAESTVSAGGMVQLNAVVITEGFANKAVLWEVVRGTGVTVSQNGLVNIPSDFDSSGSAPQIEIRATSIFDETVTGTATITVV